MVDSLKGKTTKDLTEADISAMLIEREQFSGRIDRLEEQLAGQLLVNREQSRVIADLVAIIKNMERDRASLQSNAG